MVDFPAVASSLSEKWRQNAARAVVGRLETMAHDVPRLERSTFPEEEDHEDDESDEDDSEWFAVSSDSDSEGAYLLSDEAMVDDPVNDLTFYEPATSNRRRGSWRQNGRHARGAHDGGMWSTVLDFARRARGAIFAAAGEAGGYHGEGHRSARGARGQRRSPGQSRQRREAGVERQPIFRLEGFVLPPPTAEVAAITAWAKSVVRSVSYAAASVLVLTPQDLWDAANRAWDAALHNA